MYRRFVMLVVLAILPVQAALAIDKTPHLSRSTAYTWTAGQTFPWVAFTESDSNPTCAAGEYFIFADLSEAMLKQCVNGSTSDIGAGASYLPLAGGTMAGPIGLADQYASSGSNPADTGVYRLSNNEKLCWELATPGTDLCFYIGTDDEFHFDAAVNVGGSGGPVQLTEAAVGDPGTAGKANLGVNTSHMLQWYGNGGSLRTAAYGTTAGVPIGDDTAYGAGWNGSTNTPTQNAVYDKIETLSAATGNLYACKYVGNVSAGATIYCSISNYDASESWLTQVLAQSVTVTRFYLRTVGAQPGTGSLVATLRKNGSDTSIVATVAAGTAGATVVSDTAHSVAFSAGDTFVVKLVNNASTASADLSVIMLGW